jgi:hypothetical protein
VARGGPGGQNAVYRALLDFLTHKPCDGLGMSNRRGSRVLSVCVTGRAPAHQEMLQGAVEQARQVGKSLRRHQVYIRQTLHEDLECHARLQAYERRPEAVVHAMPEGEMLVGIGAPEVKTIRVREDALVSIGGSKDHEDPGAGQQRHAMHLDVLGGRTKHALHGRVIAQSFLHNAGAQGQVVAQRVPPGGIAQQRIGGARP